MQRLREKREGEREKKREAKEIKTVLPQNKNKKPVFSLQPKPKPKQPLLRADAPDAGASLLLRRRGLPEQARWGRRRDGDERRCFCCRRCRRRGEQRQRRRRLNDSFSPSSFSLCHSRSHVKKRGNDCKYHHSKLHSIHHTQTKRGNKEKTNSSSSSSCPRHPSSSLFPPLLHRRLLLLPLQPP